VKDDEVASVDEEVAAAAARPARHARESHGDVCGSRRQATTGEAAAGASDDGIRER
jgi:hypothetical protein